MLLDWHLKDEALPKICLPQTPTHLQEQHPAIDLFDFDLSFLAICVSRISFICTTALHARLHIFAPLHLAMHRYLSQALLRRQAHRSSMRIQVQTSWIFYRRNLGNDGRHKQKDFEKRSLLTLRSLRRTPRIQRMEVTAARTAS